MSVSSRSKKISPSKPAPGFRWLIAITICISTFLLFVIVKQHSSAKTTTLKSNNATINEKTTISLTSLLEMKPHQLENVDIGLRNLLISQGLRGSENLNIDACMNELTTMKQRVQEETSRNLHQYFENPAKFENSEQYFRMLTLITVLQQDFGAIYNPDRVTPVGVFESNSRFYADSHDVFMHGLLGDQRGGTCASLPVLTIAIGRRLGYPLALVSAQNHLFVRWNDEKSPTNFEVTGLGLGTYPDDHYRKWPYPFDSTAEKANRYLLPMSASEECAVFMSIRAACLMAANRCEEALEAYRSTVKLAPDSQLYQFILEQAQREAAVRGLGDPRGMPPDPEFHNMPPEIAWMMYDRKQLARRENPYLLTPGTQPWNPNNTQIPLPRSIMPGQPFQPSINNPQPIWPNLPNQPIYPPNQ
jgi:hypothetical protein